MLTPRHLLMYSFSARLEKEKLQLHRSSLQTLQINLGRKCNQACRHCHVDAAPWRTEMMTSSIALRVVDWIQLHRPPVIDLTGGAPEISEFFSSFVQVGRSYGARVIDRNNLTILSEPGFEFLPEFLAGNEVEIIASLPCYQEANVRQQRGHGAFEKSIHGLRLLNSFGYGSRLPLHLVYNPLGPALPPPQMELEAEYREALRDQFGITFHHLLTITNQPIARFAEDLRSQGRLDSYLALLSSSFNPATLPSLMCRTTLSVGYTGAIYDCDFNQMLDLQIKNGKPLYLWDVTPALLEQNPISVGRHCFACTAGCGSSCTGALA